MDGVELDLIKSVSIEAERAAATVFYNHEMRILSPGSDKDKVTSHYQALPIYDSEDVLLGVLTVFGSEKPEQNVKIAQEAIKAAGLKTSID